MNRGKPTPKKGRPGAKKAADRPTPANVAPTGATVGAYPVAMVPITSVIPYARNPRVNAGAPVVKVAASIKEYGFRQPIVVDREGVIIAGHTRLLAALHLGLKEVPVHVAEGLTPAQAKAYRLADNRIGQEATWDDALLGLEFNDLELDGTALDLTGFNQAEINRILGREPLGGEGAGGPPDSRYQEQYGVIVVCKSETEQEDTYNRLKALGLECRVVTT